MPYAHGPTIGHPNHKRLNRLLVQRFAQALDIHMTGNPAWTASGHKREQDAAAGLARNR